MRHLLDVNVLLALAHGAHPDHGKASSWFAACPSEDQFATCSITEIGFLRVSLNARLITDFSAARAVLAGLLSSPRFIRFNDDLGHESLPGYVKRSSEITDGHLLALAWRHQASLATMDTGIPGALLINQS